MTVMRSSGRPCQADQHCAIQKCSKLHPEQRILRGPNLQLVPNRHALGLLDVITVPIISRCRYVSSSSDGTSRHLTRGSDALQETPPKILDETRSRPCHRPDVGAAVRLGRFRVGLRGGILRGSHELCWSDCSQGEVRGAVSIPRQRPGSGFGSGDRQPGQRFLGAAQHQQERSGAFVMSRSRCRFPTGT